MVDSCTFSTASYLDAVVAANQSGGCIDLAESRALFQAAHVCDVTRVGNDAIQLLYKQITGIPNSAMNPKDRRPMAGGYFRSYFIKGHPIFEEGEFFAKGKNACLNFDTVQTDRQTICEPDQKKMPDELKVSMTSMPIRWCDTNNDGIPYHIDARNGAYLTRDETANWRVLLDNEAGRPLVATSTALDLIRRNLPYPEIVEQAVRLGGESTQDPWEISQFAADVLDILIAERGIDESAKIVYANLLASYVTRRFQQLHRQVDQIVFEAQFGKTFYTFRANALTQNQLSKEWKSGTDPTRPGYYNDGVGFYHGAATDLMIVAGASYVVPFAVKAGWVAVTGGIAAAGAIIAAAPPAIVIGAVVLGVGLLSVAAVEIWSWHKGEEAHEKQYSEPVKRFVPRKDQFAISQSESEGQ